MTGSAGAIGVPRHRPGTAAGCVPRTLAGDPRSAVDLCGASQALGRISVPAFRSNAIAGAWSGQRLHVARTGRQSENDARQTIRRSLSEIGSLADCDSRTRSRCLCASTRSSPLPGAATWPHGASLRSPAGWSFPTTGPGISRQFSRESCLRAGMRSTSSKSPTLMDVKEIRLSGTLKHRGRGSPTSSVEAG